VEVVASLSQGRTAAAQCSLFTHKSTPVIFEPPCIYFTGLMLSRMCSLVLLVKVGYKQLWEEKQVKWWNVNYSGYVAEEKS